MRMGWNQTTIWSRGFSAVVRDWIGRFGQKFCMLCKTEFDLITEIYDIVKFRIAAHSLLKRCQGCISRFRKVVLV